MILSGQSSGPGTLPRPLSRRSRRTTRAATCSSLTATTTSAFTPRENAGLTRASLERALGQPIQLAALEIDMPSFKGRLSTRTNEYVWFYVTQSA